MLGTTYFSLTGPSSGNTLFKESTALCTFVNGILNVRHFMFWDVCSSYPCIAAVLCPIERAAPLGCVCLV
jgi:hypothetical protein